MSNNRIATVIAHSALAFSSCWTFTDLKLNFASIGLFLYLLTGVFGAIIHGKYNKLLIYIILNISSGLLIGIVVVNIFGYN